MEVAAEDGFEVEGLSDGATDESSHKSDRKGRSRGRTSRHHVPEEPVEGDPHRLKAGEDYRVERSRLPQGYVMLDQVRIDFSSI